MSRSDRIAKYNQLLRIEEELEKTRSTLALSRPNQTVIYTSPAERPGFFVLRDTPERLKTLPLSVRPDLCNRMSKVLGN